MWYFQLLGSSYPYRGCETYLTYLSMIGRGNWCNFIYLLMISFTLFILKEIIWFDNLILHFVEHDQVMSQRSNNFREKIYLLLFSRSLINRTNPRLYRTVRPYPYAMLGWIVVCTTIWIFPLEVFIQIEQKKSI